jgi:beta-glucosidase
MSRIIMATVLTTLVSATAAEAAAQSTRDRAIAEGVDALVARMTLPEKIGQMTQLTLSALTAAGSPGHSTARLDPHKLHEALVVRHVGSVINVVGGALTLDGWHALLGEIQDVAVKQTRLGIPVLYGIDAVHGVNYTVNATIFPHNIGMAATFNPALVRRAAEITAAELTASGLPWNFAPVLDVGRHTAWPRFYETFGEDAYLASRLGQEATEGIQASGRVAATLKHYLAYGVPRSGRDRTPAELTRAAINAGARAVMVNSGEIDGEPVHASRYWLTDVLRGELGFDGVVVTDWADITFLHTRHRVAPTMKDAVRLAVEAGIDISMTPDNYDFADHLTQLVQEGTIPVSRIDQSVRRILRLKAQLGVLDSPYPRNSDRAFFGAQTSREVAAQAARESITLLKNDGTLPLTRDVRVLVTGPAAQSLTALNGGWTYTWQGTDAGQFPSGVPNVVDAIRARAAEVRYLPGSGFTEPGEVALAAAAAKLADVAVIVLGEDAYAEWLGDLNDLTLPDAQLRLAEAVLATGTPTVLVLLQGRPRIVNSVADRTNGIVMAYWPGMSGAEAIAQVLFGETNPAGRLPFTYPRHPNAIAPYDHKFVETLGQDLARSPRGFHPQFEFGHGLSYTTFAYTDLRLSANQLPRDGKLTVSVTVKNTGSRAGQETVLLFTRQHYAAITPQVRRLRGFQKIALEPGATRTVEFTLSSQDLEYIAADGQSVLEPGKFDVMIGSLVATFEVPPVRN